MSKKPNLTSREKATLEVVRNNTNTDTIEAIHELNRLMEDTSQLLDTLYYMSIRKGSVDNVELNEKVSSYERTVAEATKSVSRATKKKMRVISVNDNVDVL